MTEIEYSALASGSSGNCFYVGNKEEAILVDVGISAKQVVERLARIGGNPEKIKAIFITHEHIDHVRGSDVLARKLNIPIFATKGTAENSFLCSNQTLINIIKKDAKINVGKLKVESFSKSHSAADPVSFNIYGQSKKENKKISVITDAGHPCLNIREHVSNSHAIFIEANHDEEMLREGPYPAFLKKWISSDQGHMSNIQAALCIKEHAPKFLDNIILSHLSKTNNKPSTALQTFRDILGKRNNFSPNIAVSIREEPTQLFRL